MCKFKVGDRVIRTAHSHQNYGLFSGSSYIIEEILERPPKNYRIRLRGVTDNRCNNIFFNPNKFIFDTNFEGNV